jgi:hypothetical protein
VSAVTYISDVSYSHLEFCNRSQLLRELAQLNAVARRRRARSERLITTVDAVELIGGGEAPLRAGHAFRLPRRGRAAVGRAAGPLPLCERGACQ